MPTWIQLGRHLWTETLWKGRWLGTTQNLERDIRRVSDAGLWQFRSAASKCLLICSQRLSRDLASAGAPPEEVQAAKRLFDPTR